MAVKLIPRESVQYSVVIHGRIDFDNTYGASNTSLTTVATHSFTLATLPANALIIAGEVAVLTAWVGPTASTIDIGDDDASGADTDRYTASPISLLSAARTALTKPVFRTTRQCSLTAELINTVAVATAGQLVWTFEYVVEGRAHEAIG